METIMLMPISTEVPPEVVDRLRAAALQVGIRQGDIIALALDAFLRRKASQAMSLQEQLSVTDFYTDSVLPARIVSGIAS
jgi:hypothetical protein